MCYYVVCFYVLYVFFVFLLLPGQQTFKQITHTRERSLTDDEKNLHQDVADTRRVSCRRAAVLPVLHGREADIIGNGDGHVEGGQQDQPVPAGLERTVVEEDETGLLDVGHLVLRNRVCIGSKNPLDVMRGK